MEIKSQDKERIVALLADQAVDAAVGSNPFFKDLIEQLKFPRSVHINRIGALTGSADYDARALVKWAEDYGTNPNDNIPALGSIILSMLSQSGVEKATTLAAIIASYRLVPRDKLDALRVQFQIPQSLGKTKPAAPIGPEFNWIGPADEVTLQGWLYAEAEFLEVALLQNAVNRARSVCRVEVPAIHERGTGVLIDDDLVLTNYHVLTSRPDDLLANAHDTILRFGAFTAEKPGTSSAATGQEIKLNAAAPVVEASPVGEYDFVLLRTDGSKAKDIVPAPFISQLPAANSAMHILQHPQGGPMMLALSKNGVTTVDAGNGKIQYVTRAAGGSSGSPCFNEQWNLVALHHAEVSQAFGSIREGILMKSIFDRIQKHLKVVPQS